MRLKNLVSQPYSATHFQKATTNTGCFLFGRRLFRFRQPEAFHDAGFLADCCLLVLFMTLKYHEVLNEDKLLKVKAATTYISCFHSKMFLASSITSKAPASDLMALKLNASVRRQSWHLSPSSLVVLSVADDDL